MKQAIGPEKESCFMPCRFAREALPLETTPVDNLFILEYMPAANGPQLSVYLYGLMMCRYPAFSEQPIADALGLTEEEVLQAFAYWQREGLLRILCADPLEVEYVAPSQRAVQPMIVPGKYHQLIQAAQQLFAPRALRATELRRLYDWVEVYSFEESAVLELISHCLNRKGPRVSMTYMDAVARAWADAGVHTAEDAKAQAAAHEEMTGGAAMILKRWNKSRRPTVDELELYEKWTKGWGFTSEAILAACPAVTRAERPSFKYLDGILERLYREGTTESSAVARLLDTEDESADLARKVFSRMGMGRAARPLERAQLSGYLEAGLPMDVLLFAAEQAVGKERAFGYLKTLLKEFLEGGVNTPAAAQTHMEARQAALSGGKRAQSAMDYPQKRYSEEELKHIFVNLDEEA